MTESFPADSDAGDDAVAPDAGEDAAAADAKDDGGKGDAEEDGAGGDVGENAATDNKEKTNDGGEGDVGGAPPGDGEEGTPKPTNDKESKLNKNDDNLSQPSVNNEDSDGDSEASFGSNRRKNPMNNKPNINQDYNDNFPEQSNFNEKPSRPDSDNNDNRPQPSDQSITSSNTVVNHNPGELPEVSDSSKPIHIKLTPNSVIILEPADSELSMDELPPGVYMAPGLKQRVKPLLQVDENSNFVISDDEPEEEIIPVHKVQHKHKTTTPEPDEYENSDEDDDNNDDDDYDYGLMTLFDLFF